MSAPKLKVPVQAVVEALTETGWNKERAAERLGIHRQTLRRVMRENGIKQAKRSFDIELPPAELLPVEDLVKRRKQQYKQKASYEKARNLINCTVRIDGPIGLHTFGDPHLDDDGTDLDAVERHTKIVNSSDAIFAINSGDSTNNWVGRLGHLYSEQSTSAPEAWQLTEWFVSGLRGHWLFMISGNHDAWSGAGDPLKWMAKQACAMYESSEVRMNLKFPNKKQVRINARHDFAGKSQYNPAHGALKSVLFGMRDHISVCGHKHVSGYSILKMDDLVCHAVQVASYKIYDRFARDKGFRDLHLSPCAFITIDPSKPDDNADMIKVWWNPEEGVEYLRFLRKRK